MYGDEPGVGRNHRPACLPRCGTGRQFGRAVHTPLQPSATVAHLPSLNSMIMAIRRFGSWMFITAALLVLHPSMALAALGVDRMPDKNVGCALLESAKQEIAANTDKFIAKDKFDILLAKLAILESQSDLQTALARARSIKNPFYSSLALGGIAATEISSDTSLATNHFREALAQAANVTHWNGTYAASFGFLFQILPSYPKTEAPLLLAASQKALDAWRGSVVQKAASLLALSKATASIAPDKAERLLLEVALKSNHYWDSTEYLGTFIAQRSLEETLKLAEQHYQARKDWPNGQYFLRAVLIELAKTDFARAFQGVKGMRELDQEIAAVKLAQALLAANRKQEAQEVVDHISALNSEFRWTKDALTTLRGQLEQDGPISSRASTPTRELIDDFLLNADATKLQTLAELSPVTFANQKQAREFIWKALPLAEAVRDMGYPHHGSPRSTALGLLVICSTVAGETDQAMEIAEKISIPELRVSYLLDAYEQVNPMPAIVSKWPIQAWQRTNISIQDRGSPHKPSQDTSNGAPGR